MFVTKVSSNLWVLENDSLRRRIDLQYRSIVSALRKDIAKLPPTGVVLDFGSGRSPYRGLLPPAWRYVSVDVEATADYRDLGELPADDRFDRIWAIETLEHLAEPGRVLRELRERLRPDGRLWISVPFSARVHPCPRDYLRWTPDALRELCESAGLEVIELIPRGSDFATIIAKLIYFFARRIGVNLWTLLGLALSPLIAGGLLLCQLPSQTSPTEAEDPLGYIVVARSAVQRSRTS